MLASAWKRHWAFREEPTVGKIEAAEVDGMRAYAARALENVAARRQEQERLEALEKAAAKAAKKKKGGGKRMAKARKDALRK